MRILSIITFIQLFFSSISFAQPRATFDYREYLTKEGDAYLEFYFQFDPTSISPNFITDSTVQFGLDLTILLQDSSNNILNYSKTKCVSPTFSTSAVSRFYFSNRMAIPNEIDNIDISLSDSLANLNLSFNFKPELKFKDKKNKVSKPLIVTSVNTIALLNKGGKNLEVDLDKNYYSEHSKIEFYLEAFASDTSKKYAIKASINENGINIMQRFVQFDAKDSPLNALMSFPLATLTKGEHSINSYLYNDAMQCIDSNSVEFNYYPKEPETNINKLINEESFISDVNTIDSLDYLIACLHPIADKIERVKIKDRKKVFIDLNERKLFFYDFWEKRNPNAPDQAWQTYLTEVKKVNDNYSTPIKEGFETDRGRIYLKYGAPNTIAKRPSEPESYPYEIWHFYKVGKFNNIRFVFYSPDMVTNDYQLLHSDMPQELNNPRWRVVLQNRNNKNTNMDNTDPGNSFGSRSQDLYNNPR
tara:strand:+ start:49901 stop:51319 length:1419 start_codon:yes stop_codon:yes gene_type:complete